MSANPTATGRDRISPRKLSEDMVRAFEKTFAYHFIALTSDDTEQEANARSMATVAFNAVWEVVWEAIESERAALDEIEAALNRTWSSPHDFSFAIRDIVAKRRQP